MNCVGGIQVLFPLLEQVNKLPVPKEVLSPKAPVIADLSIYFQDVVNCVGGIQVLFPLLEQVNKLPIPKEVLSPEAPVITDLSIYYRM